MRRLGRTRKLFAFLREHRHELFDEAFQIELEAMYRDTGAGKEPVPPALMAMVLLLQSYAGVSDAEAVELSVVDLRWQMVLGCLGAAEPAFSQGTLHDFRHRFIRANMDRRLLERTVELARATKSFDWKKLPKTLRVAIDSSPLEGAGRVEDTFNLLGHAARAVVACVAALLGWTTERVCSEARTPVLAASSIKAGLDVDWSDPDQKAEALNTLIEQLDSLQRWIERRMPEQMKEAPLRESLDTLKRLVEQDLEPDPEGGGDKKIRKGTAVDRRVSLTDPDMRHGRKSKSKRFNGYKRHIAADLDTKLILAAALTPANRPEGEAAPALRADIELQQLSIGELYVDRGYINSPIVDHLLHFGGDVFCRPWMAHNANGLFSKADFNINLRNRTVTCPGGQVQPFQLGMVVEFAAEECANCPLRAQCTTAAPGQGRFLRIADDERLQQRLRKRMGTKKGRAQLRQRVGVEHRLAHLAQRQGRRARYIGLRRNLFDLRRASAVLNLEVIHQKVAA